MTNFLHRQKNRRTEEARKQAQIEIQSDRATFIEAERQASVAGGHYDAGFVAAVKADFDKIELDVKAVPIEGIDALMERSRDLKRLRAYILPDHEIELQGKSVLAELGEWSVPSSVLKSLVEDFLPTLRSKDIKHARAALYNIFDSSDYWSMYIDWFAGFMRWVAFILMGLMLLSLVGAYFFLLKGWGATKGFILAGACGALVSVISKLPPLSPYGETAGYVVRIVSRVATGIAASVIGFGLLASGILTITLPDKVNITDMIDLCSTEAAGDLGRGFPYANSTPLVKAEQLSRPMATTENTDGSSMPRGNTTRNVMILVGLAMLLGFSERALTSFEDKIFPVAKTTTTQTTNKSQGEAT